MVHRDGKTKPASTFTSDHSISIPQLEEGQKRILFLWYHALIVSGRWSILGNDASQFIVTGRGEEEGEGGERDSRVGSLRKIFKLLQL